MKTVLPTIEQQQISIESAYSLADLQKKIRSTPMFYIGTEQKSNLYNVITISNKMPMMFDNFEVCFCNECESKWDEDISSCTNPDCLNCDIYHNPLDQDFDFALA